MFLGYHQAHISKDRILQLPADWQFAGHCVLTPGFDKNVLVLPESVWKGWVRQADSLNLADTRTRLWRRMLIGLAAGAVIDRAAELALSEHFVHMLGAETVALVGQGNYFEIWSDKNWSAQMALLQAFRWDETSGLVLQPAMAEVRRN